MSEGRKVVLVVDDEESMRFFLRKTLRREGYEVIEAADGPDAIEAANAHPPDVALLDVRMPGMDGIAVMRTLHATLPHLPVVLMTAYGSVESALHAMKHGASDYVTKPFRVDAIRTTVARALARDAAAARPPTLRDVTPPGGEREPGPPPTSVPGPAPGPLGRSEIPERGLGPFLRERVESRGLPAGDLLHGGDLGLRDIVRLSELVYVDELLSLTAGNVSRAAEIAGITRPNMHRKVTDLGLTADTYRRAGRTTAAEHAEEDDR